MLFDAISELCVTVYDETILNVVQALFSGFSAAYHYTGLSMVSSRDLNGYARIHVLNMVESMSKR